MRRALALLLVFACSERVPAASTDPPEPSRRRPETGIADDPDVAEQVDACVESCGHRCFPFGSAQLPPLAPDNPYRIRDDARAACSAEDLATLEAKLAAPRPSSFLAYGEGLTEACRACVVSETTDDEWGPIVASDQDAGGESGFFHLGACYGLVEGEACGTAAAEEHFCAIIACAPCTDQDRAACEPASRSGYCKELAERTERACPDLATTRTRCATIMDAVRVHCADEGPG